MKKHTGIILALIIIILTSVGCSNKTTPTSSGNEGDKPIAVSVTKAVKSDIESVISLNGKVKPIQEINIIPKMPGKVSKVNFDVGQTVKAGDILFTLDDKDIALQVKQAEASLNSAEIALRRAQGGSMEQQLSQLQTNLSAAQVNYNDAKLNYERTKQLYEVGGVSRQNLESAETGLKLREDQYNAAKAALDITQNKINPENIASAQAGLNQARAAYDIAKSQLDNSVIHSPIHGVVASVNINEGELVGSAGAAMTVIDLSAVIVEINVPENMINKIHLNDKVQVSIASMAGSAVEGEIISISPAADAKSQNYPVKVKIHNEKQSLKSGMFAEVRLTADKAEAAISVPLSAIVDENGKKYIFIAHEGAALKKEIKLGLSNGQITQVIDGLKEAESVIVKGQSFIQDGSKVVIEDR